jgi:DNA-binding response OmpR family regulator
MPVPKILVVSANRGTARSVSTTLRSRGYEVSVATDAGMGLAMADATAPSLIMLDLTSTLIAEGSLLSDLRRSKYVGQTPIVVLTPRVDIPDRRVQAAVLVPIEAGELFAAVRGVLGAPEPTPPPPRPSYPPPSYPPPQPRSFPKAPPPLAEPIKGRLNGSSGSKSN